MIAITFHNFRRLQNYCVVLLCFVGTILNPVWAKEPTLSGIEKAQQAYKAKKFQEVMEIIEPLLKDPETAPQAGRLKILALARMGKTPEAIEVYEKQIAKNKREDEVLLRQLAIASILPLRADMREQMRGAAYTALKEIDTPEMVKYLEEGLTDGSGMIRALVAESLGKQKAGQRSRRYREALKDSAGLVRVSVLKGLGKSGDTAAVSLVKGSLKDKQPMVQIAAAKAMFELGHKEYWDRLIAGARSEEGYERGAAIRALGDLGDTRAVPILEKAATDSQPSIRAAAVVALGKLQTPTSLVILKTSLFDSVPAVRSVAAFSMGYFPQDQVLPSLSKALLDRVKGVQAAAIASLLKVGAPFSLVEGTVHKLLQDQNPAIRSSATKALGKGRGGKVIAALTLMLNDPIPRPRIVAVRSLGRMGEHSLLPLLKRTLRDTDEAVRITAAAAIVRTLDAPQGV